MKAKIQTWRGIADEVSLASAFKPYTNWIEGGMLEHVEETANSTYKAMGRLIACLVEKKILTLEEANYVSGNSVLELIEDI